MTTSSGDTSESLDGLLRESAARWTLWHAQHPDSVDSDEQTEAVGDLIELLLPRRDATLMRLAVHERVWTHRHGAGEDTVRGSVRAALTSLIADHLETLGAADAPQRGHEPPP